MWLQVPEAAQRCDWPELQRTVVVARPMDAASARWVLVLALALQSEPTQSLVWQPEVRPVASQAEQQPVTELLAVPVPRASRFHAQAKPAVWTVRPERRRLAWARSPQAQGARAAAPVEPAARVAEQIVQASVLVEIASLPFFPQQELLAMFRVRHLRHRNRTRPERPACPACRQLRNLPRHDGDDVHRDGRDGVSSSLRLRFRPHALTVQ